MDAILFPRPGFASGVTDAEAELVGKILEQPFEQCALPRTRRSAEQQRFRQFRHYALHRTERGISQQIID